MANSSYLTKVVEPFIVEWVSKQIGIDLRPGKIIVGRLPETLRDTYIRNSRKGERNAPHG
jgi:hypothetical protein